MKNLNSSSNSGAITIENSKNAKNTKITKIAKHKQLNAKNSTIRLILIASSSIKYTSATDAIKSDTIDQCVDDPSFACSNYQDLCDSPVYNSLLSLHCRKTCNVCSKNTCFNKKCDHLCELDSLNNSFCKCNAGFTLDPVTKTKCFDVNECEVCSDENNKMKRCPQVCKNSEKPYCHNLQGTFECSRFKCTISDNKALYYKQDECCELSSTETCGLSAAVKQGSSNEIMERVVGGETTKSGFWPWQVYILIERDSGEKQKCSGTLVSKDVVVSAAHCFDLYGDRLKTITMFLGVDNQNISNIASHNVLTRYPKLRDDNSPMLFIHPEYDYPDRDIAVIILNREVKLDASITIGAVCLHDG